MDTKNTQNTSSGADAESCRPNSVQQMRENPFMLHNFIEVNTVRRDYAELFIDIRRETTNSYGFVHGGAFFTMADCCAGMTARTDGRRYVTQDASVQFLHNTGSGRITACGTVLSRGKRVCVVEVRVADEAGGLLFHGTFSMFCINP